MLQEKVTTNGTTETHNFFYDNTGKPYAMQVDGTTYYYITNLQGDVMGLVDSSGNTVATYTYDPYGKPLTATGELAEKNPLRYRGYYYDSESGLYYLQSRYYDPVIRRWINADALISTNVTSCNLFTYCFNNPGNMADYNGYFPEWITDWGEEWWEENVQPIIEFVRYIQEDKNNFNRNNEDEMKVLQSYFFSVYKGTTVIRVPSSRSGTFGAMFLSWRLNADEEGVNTVRHEYGHVIQMEELGVFKFIPAIGIPSILESGSKPYYDKPWELTADVYGGVTNRTHSEEYTREAFEYLEKYKNFKSWIYAMIQGLAS